MESGTPSDAYMGDFMFLVPIYLYSGTVEEFVKISQTNLYPIKVYKDITLH